MKKLPHILLLNTILYLGYFMGIFVITSLLFKKSITGEVYNFYTIPTRLPDTFTIVLWCSLLFLIFTILVSVIVATREQNHFRTSFIMRLILFLMNIMPIALFQHVLFKKFGFGILYFVIIYLVLQLILDLLFKSLISKMKMGSPFSLWFSKIIPELLVIGVSLFVVFAINGKNSFMEMRSINRNDFFELSGYFLYIVFFNAVTFFTVEYCIATFRDEYKKNYVKYHFMLNDNYFKRLFFILRNSIPRVLEKVRKNLSWLVMFIITVDCIFENPLGIGSYLLDAYHRNDPSPIIKNIFYLFIIMYFINTIISIAIELLKKTTEDKKKPKAGCSEAFVQRNISGGKRSIIYGGFIAVFLIAYIVLFAINQRDYAFAGYYDFASNMGKTVGDFLEDKKIYADRYPPEMTEYINTMLCEKTVNPSGFSVIILDIQHTNGEISHLVPYFDKTSKRYFFIEKNVNKQYLVDISPQDEIFEINRIYKYMPFADKMTGFRLQADTDKTNFSHKPLYLIIPFYLFYFMTLVIVVVLFTFSLYSCIVLFYFSSKPVKRFFTVPVKILKKVLLFFNSLTLIVVFLLVNFFIEKNMQIVWINKPFVSNFISYTLIQLIVIIMFSDSYINEIILFVKGVLETKEFEYYRLIGLNNRNQKYVLNEKYGCNLLLKLIFQNILFVFNINWFISYAFNVWPRIRDFIGITYSISFENIFTKIVHFHGSNTGFFNFVLLIILNAVMFAGYFYFDNKTSKR